MVTGNPTKPQFVAAESFLNAWGGEKRLDKVTEPERAARLPNARAIAEDYYDHTTDSYEGGWGSKFHFSRLNYPGESMHTTHVRAEHFLALMMRLRPGMRVLDAGCGVGGPARELARFARCSIVGVNVSNLQVRRATRYAQDDGLQDRCRFVIADFNKLPFEDGEFDAAFAIEATVYATDLADAYAEIGRVVKPGGVFGLIEWVMTDEYDDNDAEHRIVRNRIERGNGITNMRTLSQCRQAVLNAGYQIEYEEDLNTRDDQLSWYWPTEGKLRHVSCWADFVKVLFLTPFMRRVMSWLVNALVFLWLMPVGMKQTQTTLAYCVDGVTEGGKRGIFTPSALFICRKPE